MRKILLSMSIILSQVAISAPEDGMSHKNIDNRTKPMGAVTVKSDAPSSAAVTITKDTGKNIYNKYCHTCHAEKSPVRVALKSPLFRSKEEWKERIKGGTKEDMQRLLDSAINGVGGMPAKGTCMECAPAELNAAIEYMLPKKD